MPLCYRAQTESCATGPSHRTFLRSECPGHSGVLGDHQRLMGLRHHLRRFRITDRARRRDYVVSEYPLDSNGRKRRWKEKRKMGRMGICIYMPWASDPQTLPRVSPPALEPDRRRDVYIVRHLCRLEAVRHRSKRPISSIRPRDKDGGSAD